MARPILLSNGSLHVGLNKFGLVHDFYYPYVGLENHAAAKSLRHKIGVWVDGAFSWLDDGAWQFTFTYPYKSLIGRTRAQNDALGIILEFEDTVDAIEDVFVRNIHIVNQQDTQRTIRLFMHQVFAIGDSSGYGDTAQYLPDDKAVLHYRGHRAFVIGGTYASGKPFDRYSVGLFGIEGHDGTYRDAEDGELWGNAVEHGRVDSVIGFELQMAGHDSSRVYYWVAAGKNPEEALVVDRRVRAEGVLHRILITDQWWHKWLEKTERFANRLDEKYQRDFINSVLLIKAHIDKRGAVIASTDTTMLNYSRDAYAYCWPRDGAYGIWPLVRLGYQEEPLQFFNFCRRSLHSRGYLMHKYQSDGALGSSWHPYVHGSVTAPPIQEDETALVLFTFAQYYQMHAEPALLHDFYSSFVKPMADFLASFVDPHTNLPKSTYDLWEEKFLTSTYTTATVYAALLAAADLADDAEDAGSAVRWRSVANDIFESAHKYLYNTERRCLYKGVFIGADGNLVYDPTVDSSSVFGSFMFGLFALNSEQIQDSIKTLQETFRTTAENPGLPRYEQDNYRRVSDESIGNPWFVTTLWLAQYHTEAGETEQALRLVDWVQGHMLSTAVLSEQINPYDGAFVSVAPLMWSQAEFVSTLLDIYIHQNE
ncbi:MAG TPA: glycoside hydrolase family 15 protein [Candidatus Saccharimonadales bacterium]